MTLGKTSAERPVSAGVTRRRDGHLTRRYRTGQTKRERRRILRRHGVARFRLPGEVAFRATTPGVGAERSPPTSKGCRIDA